MPSVSPAFRALLGAPARLGRISLTLLALAVVLQLVSFVQQVSYLFEPRPGELPLVVIGIVLAVLVALTGVAAGTAAAMSPSGRRTGAFGAALGLAAIVLWAVGSAFLWRMLDVL